MRPFCSSSSYSTERCSTSFLSSRSGNQPLPWVFCPLIHISLCLLRVSSSHLPISDVHTSILPNSLSQFTLMGIQDRYIVLHDGLWLCINNGTDIQQDNQVCYVHYIRMSNRVMLSAGSASTALVGPFPARALSRTPARTTHAAYSSARRSPPRVRTARRRRMRRRPAPWRACCLSRRWR